MSSRNRQKYGMIHLMTARANDFYGSNYDYCLYSGKNIWILIHVDDILIVGFKQGVEETVLSLKLF